MESKHRTPTMVIWNIFSSILLNCIHAFHGAGSKNNFDQLFTFEIPSFRFICIDVEYTAFFFWLSFEALFYFTIRFFLTDGVWYEKSVHTAAGSMLLCRWVSSSNIKIKSNNKNSSINVSPNNRNFFFLSTRAKE